ncbi:hypothetical protein CKY20_10395 [Capnocytophaga canis]|uniref:Carboxypeptidase-like regulatory domain-containing protein n=2 Tax=Capnocytophaga canis TaxID=1848903 RepID=A0A3A1YDD4_9FLAO|nr:hypothetical protein CKY20_10395 [Capnocytophaga canis]
MINMKLIFIILLFSSPLFSQSKYEGHVLDVKTNAPIYGVYISVNDKVVASTDDNGFFSFEGDEITTNDRICFSHISYKTLCLFGNEIGHQYHLELGVNELSEVNIYQGGEKVWNVLEKVKDFEKKKSYYVTPDFWAKSHGTARFYNKKGTLVGYSEIVGQTMLLGDVRKNPFCIGFNIPQQIRRSPEKMLLETDKTLKNNGILFKSPLYFYGFSMLKLTHPLFEKNTSKFVFEKVDDEYLTENAHTILEYKQVKEISTIMGKCSNMSGKIWLDENNKIFKETASFDEDNASRHILTVEYVIIGEHHYPSKISYHKFALTREVISQKTHIQLTHITPVKNEYDGRHGFLSEMYLYPSLKYDSKFWKKYPIENTITYDELKKMAEGMSLDAFFRKATDSPENLFNKQGENYKYIIDRVIPTMEYFKKIRDRDMK